jgi:SPOR domain
VGTGAAFAYRTYVGAPRSGEPPIIKADNSPTKVVPAPGDSAASKTPDRMLPGDGGEKLVSREEAPVDVNSKSGPRVVFPPLGQNGSPPPVASVSPAAPPPATAANGTMPNSEPRKIKTLAVKGDAAENGGAPAGVSAPAKPAARTPAAAAPAPRNPSSANASANAPLSLSPQGAPEPAPTRVAATTPAQTAPSGGGGYLVQVSSQKNEADAQASYRALQGKYPSVLGSQTSVVKRVDLGEKGVYYRAFAGPFSSVDQATQVCSNLKAAGGPQCIIQRN